MEMIKKTKDYNMFKLTDINRADGIDRKRVDWLKQQIKRRNLLDMCPIMVNKDMEIVQGQHRWQAAKELGLELYYEVKELEARDILDLNSSKQWNLKDYLNFWVKQEHKEYIKLNNFMKDSNLPFDKAMRLCTSGDSTRGVSRNKFKNGEYVHKEFKYKDRIEQIFEVVHKIKSLKPYSHYVNSSRFFNSLVKIMDHEHYIQERLLINLERLCDKIGLRANEKGYVEMLCEIFNWRTTNKITFTGEE